MKKTLIQTAITVTAFGITYVGLQPLVETPVQPSPVSLVEAIKNDQYQEYRSQGCTPNPKFLATHAIINRPKTLEKVTFEEAWTTSRNKIVMFCR